MFQIFEIIGIPLGWLLWAIYKVIPNYFVSIFIFTLLVRAATFPFSLKSQKAQADRAKLAPRQERIQKKYKGDPKKLQEKQMALYQKEGVSLTGGCLPMLIPMIVLFGVISVIYSPLKHLARVPDSVITAAEKAVTLQGGETKAELPYKVDSKEMTGYYKELRMLRSLDDDENQAAVKAAIVEPAGSQEKADEYIEQMLKIKKDFNFFGGTLLEQPWRNGFKGINILWLIPILSGLTAMGSSLLSMYYMKQGQGGDKQPGQGCSNVLMLIIMPLFSLGITFTVPGGVGVYWICSNIIAVGQTALMNQIYNPAKIRAQAFAEDAERRRRKQEDKQRLADARAREEEEDRRLAAEERERIALKEQEVNKPRLVEPSKNPNKQKRRSETAEGAEQMPEDSAGEAVKEEIRAMDIPAPAVPDIGVIPAVPSPGDIHMPGDGMDD